MRHLLEFVERSIPSLRAILILGPVFLLWVFGCLAFAAYLKCLCGVKTGYTRKTFHVLVFLTAAGLHQVSGLPLVCLFGAMTTLVLAYALVRGDGHPLYEAIAREKDSPRRTYYIVVPYLATLAGGVMSSVWFGPAALIGYLVCGLGDAAGEPVGTRWGRHSYSAPAFGRVKSTRTVEGSLGVLVVSLAAILIGMALAPGFRFTPRSLAAVPLVALACAVLEAVTPHGWDNWTMQLGPALLASLVL